MAQFKPEDFARVMGVMDTDVARARFDQQVRDMLQASVGMQPAYVAQHMGGQAPVDARAAQLPAPAYSATDLAMRQQQAMMPANPVAKPKPKDTISLEQFVGTEVSAKALGALHAMINGRVLRGLGSPLFNVRASVAVEFDTWNDKATLLFSANLQLPTPQAAPLPTATSRVVFSGVNDPAGILGRYDPAVIESLKRVALDLAAPFAVFAQLPESARKIVDTLAAPIILNGVSGYRTKIESGMEWFEPTSEFPSDALLGRIIALA